MPNQTEFPFANARRISESEVIAAEKAIKQQFGINLTQSKSSLKNEIENYQSISIKLHPKIITWAKAEAEKKGVEYQVIINEVLLKAITV
ncbi:AT hook motif protein [Pseudanabaena minima]|uniref:AT hook motif protein n=1 Tax=Pseudanabaena minima TaxID=890415 RepID=UPI003DAA362E